MRSKNARDEQWLGKRLGPEAAPEKLGANAAYKIEEIDQIVPALIDGRTAIHANVGFDAEHDESIFGWMNVLREQRKSPPGEIAQLSLSLHELRVIKSPAEQRTMQRAADITVQAHKRAMETCSAGMYEWQLDATLQYEFLRHGARTTAYQSIVGSSANACVMHYIQNSSLMNNGDLVLIDAGCEFDYYASDLTRTFPVSGKFSPRQRDLYEIVLHAQKEAIKSAKPGAKFNDPHETSRRALTQGLIDLGLIKETLNSALEQELDRRFLVHRCSHWLGMDVHDVGSIQENGSFRALEPGMVLTIEPGIYIPHNDTMQDVDEEWHNTGIRIEDDVLVTLAGQHVLTQGAPKEIGDIEDLMNDGM